MPTPTEVLTDLNRAYIDSVQDADVARFETLLAPDFRCSNPDGSLVDRAGFLRQIARGPGIDGLRAEDVEIRLMGDVAIVHAATSYRDGAGIQRRGRYTDVWRRDGERWLAVSAHVTRGA
jgi:ketosteroid isomerase-like protein